MKRRIYLAGLAGGLVLLGIFLVLRHRQENRVGRSLPANPAQARSKPNRFQPPASAAIASVPAPRASSFLQAARETTQGSLSAHEEQVLERLYAQLVTEREKIELGLLKVDKVDEHSVMITIPEFTERGMELYADFGDEVMAELGRERGRELLQRLDALIRASNGQFGLTEQNLLLEDHGDTVHIVHGNGALAKFGAQTALAEVRSVSVLKRNQLLKYEYLRPYLPGS